MSGIGWIGVIKWYVHPDVDSQVLMSDPKETRSSSQYGTTIDGGIRMDRPPRTIR
jgi:hypothetical protein